MMKQALVYTNGMARAQKLDFAFVGNIHDEIQAEVLDTHTEKYGRIAVRAIEMAGQHFNMRCPTTGEFKVGQNWSQTH